MPENRTETGQFAPGVSGNPGGRPRKRLLDERLTEILESGQEADEIAKALILLAKTDIRAAQLVAERTQGKPKQKIEHSGEDGGPIEASLTVRFVDADGK